MSVFDPPLPRAARQAVVQPVMDLPSRAIASSSGPADAAASLDRYRADQREATVQARTSPMRYVVSKVQQTITRLEPQMQHLDGDEWGPAEVDDLDLVLQHYHWPSLGMGLGALAGLQSYHYTVTGEYGIVRVQVESGLEWRVHPWHAVSMNKPKKGQATVRLVAGGQPAKGTAYVVDADQVEHCWNPDADHPGQAFSPTLAAIEPLRQHSSVVRHMRKLVDARSAMGGGGKTMAFDTSWVEQLDQDGNKILLERIRDYYSTPDNPDDMRTLMPLLLYGDMTNGREPKVLDVIAGFDDKLMTAYNTTFEAVAQSVDLSGLTVAKGGPGEANHWNEWELKEENWKNAGAPVADKVYADITSAYWFNPEHPERGLGARIVSDPENFRIYYDPSPVVTPPNKSEQATDLWRAGALKLAALLEAHGFDPDTDAMLPAPDASPEEKARAQEELDLLLSILSAGRVQEGGISTTETIRKDVSPPGQGPPGALPPGGGQPPKPPGPGGPSQTPPAPRTPPALNAAVVDRRTKVNRALNRYQRLRDDLAKTLRAKTDDAISHAVNAATGRVAARVSAAKQMPAEKRNGQKARLAAMADEILDACAGRCCIGPYLGALGLTEEELLDTDLGLYQEEVENVVGLSLQKQRAALETAGVDPSIAGTDQSAQDAAVFAGAYATARARQALTQGVAEPTEQGEWSGTVSGGFARDVLGILAGVAVATLAANPDVVPTVSETGVPSPFEQIADGEGMQIVFTWVHGAFGEPERPFEPHEELDGEPFDDPFGADAGGDKLAIPDPSSGEDVPDYSWIESETGGFYPGDHDGCTCNFDVELTAPTPAESSFGTESGL